MQCSAGTISLVRQACFSSLLRRRPIRTSPQRWSRRRPISNARLMILAHRTRRLSRQMLSRPPSRTRQKRNGYSPKTGFFRSQQTPARQLRGGILSPRPPPAAPPLLHRRARRELFQHFPFLCSWPANTSRNRSISQKPIRKASRQDAQRDRKRTFIVATIQILFQHALVSTARPRTRAQRPLAATFARMAASRSYPQRAGNWRRNPMLSTASSR
jgi:hypothetical protein